MASSSAPAAGPHGDNLVQDLKNKLYNLCAMEESSTVFRQDDLLAFNVIPNNDIRLLLQISQRLCDEKLFKLVRDGSAAGWMYRSVAEATKSVSFGDFREKHLTDPSTADIVILTTTRKLFTG